ncbi:MAG: right-handed parallel beta-helix repeat-containing protein [Planctomycetaceae bacterium]|nr:MAG: right-handed parallel beta-helix repeat-containing protein [Planctomycetaceae bacterium]
MRKWIVLVVMLLATPVAAADFFVAPAGDDTADGTRQAPFATLTRARDAVRARKAAGPLTEPVRVIVQDGQYTLTEPLVLEPVDSGTADAPIVYQAAQGARPVFSGGQTIGGWQPGENGIWTTHLPEVAAGDWYFEQLFVDGVRATRAREPNQFYFYIQDVHEESLDDQGGRRPQRARQTLRMRPDDFAVLADLDEAALRDVNLVVYHNWDNTRRFPDRLDPEQQAIITTGQGMKPWNPWRRNSHYRLENFLEALDEPGEWFLDRDGTLYYHPLPGQDMTRAHVVAPVIDRFVAIRGDAASGNFVEHITIQGLVFQHAQWLTPPEGFEPAQAAAPIEAVVMADGARHITLSDCEIGHVGTYAVWFRKGCFDCTLQNSLIHDFGAGGVRIGETGIAANQAERTARITVDNNIIRHGGYIFPCAVGVWIGQSSDNRVSHNDIADLFYTGISVGWRWGYAESLAKRNTIEFNRVRHIGKGLLSDMGGIYTLGPSQGTVVRNNVFHDIYAYSYGGWGLYTDEGSTGILFENNLVYRVKTGGFHQHYGRENVIRNNILAFSELYQVQATRVEDHLSFTFENNIVYYDQGVLLRGPWDRLQHESRKNCYWHAGDQPVEFLGNTLEQWQQAGHEAGSIVADPQLADPQNDDFQVSPDSPAIGLGFRPFDPSRAGVRGEAWRKKADAGQFPPLEIAPEPPPLSIHADFEFDTVGQPPSGVQLRVEDRSDLIVVTDQTASSGSHSVKVTDAPDLQHAYNPHFYFSGIDYRAGRVQNQFDLRVEPAAIVHFQWRDWSSQPYVTGPDFQIRDGRLVLDGKTRMELPVGRWTRFEIVATLDESTSTSWALRVTPAGQPPQEFTDLPNVPLNRVTWVGFMSLATEETIFYLDNFSLTLTQ